MGEPSQPWDTQTTFQDPKGITISQVLRTLVSRWVKSALGWLALRTGVYRLFLHNTAIVVLFHRVGEAIPDDPIGCSEEKFTRFCDMFARYFRVVSLETLVAKIQKGGNLGGHLAITFDDGYLDNLTTASQILTERNLIASFFVATGYIGTERVPGWDADANVQPAWMTWDDVRTLRRYGFEIGAHTINHVNLGDTESFERFRAKPLPESWNVEVDPDTADFEIAESKRHLERELAEPVQFFSYPFGRPENLTERNRDIVLQSGFKCCVSAYGGTVDAASSLFDLPRMPVSQWHVSPSHFVFEAMRSTPTKVDAG